MENCLSVNNMSLCWKTQLIKVFSGIMAPPGTPKAPAKTCAVAVPFCHPLNTFHPTKFPHSLDLTSCGFCLSESHKDTGNYWDWDRCQAWNGSALNPPDARSQQSRRCVAVLPLLWANSCTFGFLTTDAQPMARRPGQVLPYLPLRVSPEIL